MPKPNQRNVVPNGDQWRVTKPEADRASGVVATQAQAIERAREILERDGGGELRIHGRDGKLRDSDTVPPGNDPNPPRDRK